MNEHCENGETQKAAKVFQLVALVFRWKHTNHDYSCLFHFYMIQNAKSNLILVVVIFVLHAVAFISTPNVEFEKQRKKIIYKYFHTRRKKEKNWKLSICRMWIIHMKINEISGFIIIKINFTRI